MVWGTETDSASSEVLLNPLPVLDEDERNRLRDVIGPAVSDGADPFPMRQRRDAVIDLRDSANDSRPAPMTPEDRLVTLSFIISDIDRKVDKLADTTALIEQLGDQVRRLSERIARIEHILVAADRRSETLTRTF